MRLFSVLAKGVIIVPNTTPWTGPWLGATRSPSLQRVANRPIICHVLDTLLEAGVVEVAVVTPPGATDEIAACISSEGPAGVAVRHLVNDRRGDSKDTLPAAAEFVGDAACVLHRADGLLGQPLSPFLEMRREESSDALLLVQDDDLEARRLRLVPQQLLSTTEDGLTPAPGGVAGVCLLGPGALARLASTELSAETLDISALAEQLARDGGRVHMRLVHKWHHFTGDALDLLDMNRTMLDKLDPELTPTAGNDNRFEGPIADPSHGVCDLERHHRAGDNRRRRADRRLLHRSAHGDRRARAHRRRGARALDRARRRERAARGRAPRGEHRRPSGAHLSRLLDATRAAPAGRRRR